MMYIGYATKIVFIICHLTNFQKRIYGMQKKSINTTKRLVANSLSYLALSCDLKAWHPYVYYIIRY